MASEGRVKGTAVVARLVSFCCFKISFLDNVDAGNDLLSPTMFLMNICIVSDGDDAAAASVPEDDDFSDDVLGVRILSMELSKSAFESMF